MRPALRLLACLVVLGALAARGQDVTAPPDEGDSSSDDRLVLTASGHAEAITSSVVLEFQIRGQGETAAAAEHEYEKRVKKLLEGLPDEAPVTTRIPVELQANRHVRVDGFLCDTGQGGGAAFVKKPGATVSGRFFVAIRDLASVPPALARKRLAQVLASIADNDITGAEDDCDIMAAHLVTDVDLLRRKSREDAFRKAWRRAALLARLSQRKLGRMTVVRDLGTTSTDEQIFYTANYYNVVYPGQADGWRASLVVSVDTQVEVEFELE